MNPIVALSLRAGSQSYRIRQVEDRSNGRISRPRSGSAASGKGRWRFLEIDQANNRVKIGTGFLFHGKRDPIVVGETWVTISGGTLLRPHYATVYYAWGSGNGQILPDGVDEVRHPNSTAFQVPLHSFYRVDGQIMHLDQHQDRDLLLGGFFG